VETEQLDLRCTVVIDAAGKLSRLTRRRSAGQFGIQYFEAGGRGNVLEFWFFPDGYGGAVSVEGGRSNFCFLINKGKLPAYTEGPAGRKQLVTGPIAYEALASDYLAIGDAAGMVDPFCGEGMRHALNTGLMAAGVVARGIRERKTYDEIRWAYEAEWRRRWERKRLLTSALRMAMERPGLFRLGLRFRAGSFIHRLWE
jgi:flavin-dependent dehydrogenase